MLAFGTAPATADVQFRDTGDPGVDKAPSAAETSGIAGRGWGIAPGECSGLSIVFVSFIASFRLVETHGFGNSQVLLGAGDMPGANPGPLVICSIRHLLCGLFGLGRNHEPFWKRIRCGAIPLTRAIRSIDHVGSRAVRIVVYSP